MSRLYGDIHRATKMSFDTRLSADQIEAIAVKSEIDEGARASIESRDVFFSAMIDRSGGPIVSCKSGIEAIGATTIEDWMSKVMTGDKGA